MTYVAAGRPSALQVIFTLSVMMAISGTLFKVVLLGLTKKEKKDISIQENSRKMVPAVELLLVNST